MHWTSRSQALTPEQWKLRAQELEGLSISQLMRGEPHTAGMMAKSTTQISHACRQATLTEDSGHVEAAERAPRLKL